MVVILQGIETKYQWDNFLATFVTYIFTLREFWQLQRSQSANIACCSVVLPLQSEKPKWNMFSKLMTMKYDTYIDNTLTKWKLSSNSIVNLYVKTYI